MAVLRQVIERALVAIIGSSVTLDPYFLYGELYYQVQQFREIKRSSYRILVE